MDEMRVEAPISTGKSQVWSEEELITCKGR